ncbi:CPBP family intramembrane glutamic endopeptidase [Enterococcus sp. 3C8_DIV0646]|uniref:CPBP family intramembrane glutamic endopeptidase n=1 Tax=Enterococcus sp. 3C8_DIV0646 TaxID=1834175 RepID=UPI000A35262B|nr:CPBP family intramembrane glutamic endopeptidase [Enterococcus sp. 3C8_DIV0646]
MFFLFIIQRVAITLKDVFKMKHKSTTYLFILTLVIGLTYQMLPYTPLSDFVLSIIGTVWNVILAFGAGYFLLRRTFLEQFKHFRFIVLLWGVPFVILTGVFFSFIYAAIFGQPTTNSIGETITVQMVFLQVPFMLMGEELLSTNLLLALQKKGFSFLWSSIICSVLFALWHIPAYGFHPAQLLITLMPARLALNFVWKKSNSVWVSWICHFLYDGLGFISFFR